MLLVSPPAIALLDPCQRFSCGLDTVSLGDNVLNTHDDGISLDMFVDWLIDSGQHIERIDDYGEWLSRFEAAMKALPENQRKNSLLPLLNAYARPAVPLAGSHLPAEKFRAAVQSAGLGSSNDVPHLTQA